MLLIDAGQTRQALDFPSLVDALEAMFRSGCETPLRHHHHIDIGRADSEGNLLLMPAWKTGAGVEDAKIAIKIATVFPTNIERALPGVFANVLLLDGATGQPEAMIDGVQVTVRRTAAASALAARYLAREDASTLAMIGTGAMAPNLIHAHAAVRPIKRVLVWGRSLDKAEALANEIDKHGIEAIAVEDRQTAVANADIVSCATLSSDALLEGAWLKPGTHVDLVGAFRADMRESDDEVMRRGRVYIDTEPGAFKEAGDIVQALESGALAKGDIQGDLFRLCRGEVAGRGDEGEITVFKSVGTALEDLAAAMLCVERVGN